MKLLQMTLSGGVLILVVALLRGLTFHRLPKRAFSLLWLMPLLRLLVPVFIPFRFSAQTVLGRAGAVTAGGRTAGQALPAAAVPLPDLFRTLETAAVPDASGPSLSLVLWAAGALLCAGYFLIAYLRCLREFRTSLPVEDAGVTAWLAARPLRRRIGVRQSDRIAAPLTYGLVRPVILLPKGMDRESLPYVLEHELTHIRRFDGLYKLALTAALCIHWFNPLVWLMARIAGRDIELACDEAVLRRMGRGDCAGYARALIRMEEKKGAFVPFYNSFSKTAIEERVTAMMRQKPASVLLAVLAVFCVACAALFFATTAAGAGETEAKFTEQADASAGEGPGIEELLEEYRPFGITGEDGELYYHGELIRYFLDGYEDGESTISRYVCYNGGGTVDVHTVREDQRNADGSTDLFGPITDIVPYSQEEFDAAVFDAEDSLAGGVEATEARGSGGGDGRSLEEIFADYAGFGVTYVPTAGGRGNVYWNGELLRAWIDVKPDGDIFTFCSEAGGTAAAYAEYDGKGTMTGVRYEPEDPGDGAFYDALRQETAAQWDAALAPYVPFGLSYEYDPDDGLNGHGLTMWFDGKEVRGIVDERQGIWITEHMGDGYYAGDAIELYAVYQYGVLSGLRPATAEEQALWDGQRAGNAAGTGF